MFRVISESEKKKLRQDFKDTEVAPFAHQTVHGLLEDHYARECAAEFRHMERDHFAKFVHYANPDFEFEKHALNQVSQMPEALAKLFRNLHSPEFVRQIEELTGMTNLMVDEQLWGGGLHMTKKGGYLAVHKDFSVLPSSFKREKQLLRVINIIGYLNPEWKPEFGGHLELWDSAGTKCEKTLEPKFNDWVIFDTRGSFHGHPHPYKGDEPRYSIATYYYQELTVEREKWSSTEYLRLPWREESPDYMQRRKDRANAELRYKGML